jgi:DNA-binding XRE family transcriptional regulator
MGSLSLIELRRRLGMSQTKMAIALGVGRRTLGMYESGVSEIPKSVALACSALAFGLPPMD